MTTTSEILNRAADLIEDRGWAQGDWNAETDDLPMCLEGGILAAMGLATVTTQWGTVTPAGFVQCPAMVAVTDFLEGQRPFDWNDKEDRTAEEVIEVLRAAALIEQARENTTVAEKVPA